ncbi:glycosyltransferase [Endozoicomonas sp. ALD040]|uniref:glycosyltransferase n=1 Tax=Endozoicomonas sp. ALD040 TaxID=3403079 RepID=UPI003BAF3D57
MAFVVNSNFITNFKAQRKAKELKSHLITLGEKKDYSSVHQLISQETYQSLYSNNTALSVIKTPRIITILNEARDHYVELGEIDKAYDCFSQSLSIRNRQRENIDLEISRQIDQGQLSNVLKLAKKGYDAYKHTRYLALQAFLQAVLSESSDKSCDQSILEDVNGYIQSGKLKGFYRLYLKNKLYHNDSTKAFVYTMLKKGVRDPLIKQLLLKIIKQSNYLNIKICNRYVDLCITTLVEANKSVSDAAYLIENIDVLPDGDSRNILKILKMAGTEGSFDEAEKLFYRLKLASSRYHLIKLLAGTNAEAWIDRLAHNACKWKSPTFIARIFKLLFDAGKTTLLIDLYDQLSNEHQQHKQIFNFYLGSLRVTDQLKKAKEMLAAAPDSVPEITLLTQSFFINKKEKRFGDALGNARQIYQLQSDRNKQRWAMAIVELLAAESDFEAAYAYVKQHPQYANALLPLIHFREGTLAKIEDQLKSRILAGEVSDELHYYLSYLHCERKEYTQAIEQITAAVKLKVSRRNAFLYILLKIVVKSDFKACLELIQNSGIDKDLLFAKYYAYSLIQLGRYQDADDYLYKQVDVFNATEKGKYERLLLLSNSARLIGNHQKSFTLFSEIFPKNQRNFASKDDKTHSFSVMNLQSTADVITDHNQPLISVIMTNFGWTEYTPVAIQSILDQTHSNFELVIVDDRSESNAYRKLAKFVKHKKDKRINLIRLKKNSGTYRAKNHGLKAATGEYITFQDSDDWSHPNRLEVQLDKLKSEKVMALVVNYCRVDVFSVVNLHNGNIMRKGPITLFYKREVFETLGYFDSVRTSADSELLDRIAAYFGSDALFHFEAPYYIASYHDRSLTSYGPLSLDPILGVKGARREYSSAYKAWHKDIIETNKFYIEFPVKQRKFNAPEILSL